MNRVLQGGGLLASFENGRPGDESRMLGMSAALMWLETSIQIDINSSH